jgi:alpha 1,3-glucosidase
MDQNEKNTHYGWNFMEDDRWLEKFVSWLEFEEHLNWKRESYMIGVFMNQRHHYGLAERQAEFSLKETHNTDPYRLYAVDLFPHEEWNPQGLYSGIPYIQGHNSKHDAGLMLLSAAETWVDLIGVKTHDLDGRIVNFISESGALEIFLFGSSGADSPKTISHKFAKITGYQ